MPQKDYGAAGKQRLVPIESLGQHLMAHWYSVMAPDADEVERSPEYCRECHFFTDMYANTRSRG
jgi:hypothetical protein